MTEDKVVEDFFEMFPNCPNPEHQPMVVRHLVQVFKNVTDQRARRELLDAQAIEDSKKESINDDEGSEDE